MTSIVMFFVPLVLTFSCSESAKLNSKKTSASESEIFANDQDHEFKVGSSEIKVPSGAIASAFKAEAKNVSSQDLKLDLPASETELAGVELRILHPDSNQPLNDDQIIKPLAVNFILSDSLFDLTTQEMQIWIVKPGGIPTKAEPADITVSNHSSETAITLLTRYASAAYLLILGPAGQLFYGLDPMQLMVGEQISPNLPELKGVAPWNISVQAALPLGLAIASDTGAISGIPLASSQSSLYTISARHALGTKIGKLTIVVTDHSEEDIASNENDEEAEPEVLQLAYSTSSTSLTLGLAMADMAPVQASTGLTAFTIHPALPSGLSLNPANGVISGTPTVLKALSSHLVSATKGTGSVQFELSIAVVPTQNPPEGYALVSSAVSGLSYDYYIMKYEASLATGTFGTNSSVATSEADLASCQHSFHEGQLTTEPKCGNIGDLTAKVQSIAAHSPAKQVSFSQAFFACRNSSDAMYSMRLPTFEEWQRAALMTEASYSNLWQLYADDQMGNCNVAGTLELTGAGAQCKSFFEVFDLAGNLAEWVDERYVAMNLTDEALARHSFGPTLARRLANGLHSQVSLVQGGRSKILHNMTPPVEGLAMSLGADHTTPAAPYEDTKSYGADVQRWHALSTASDSLGFRCVAFAKGAAPSMKQLALPDEPVFTGADLPVGEPENWTVPENRFIQDAKVESLAVTGDVSSGAITISWKPWVKKFCQDESCATIVSEDAAKYEIYRWIEPVRFSERLGSTWALSGGTNPYAADTQLDPRAIEADGTRKFAPIASIVNCTTLSPANCQFEDAGVTFSEMRLYRYLLVASDADGSEIVAQTQRYRSPYYTGLKSAHADAAFRLEPRYRRQGVFVNDAAYMTGTTPPQEMVRIPMDVSGFDRDYFIGKHDAAYYSGPNSNDGTAGRGPAQDDGAGAWVSDAAKCEDQFHQTQTFAAECGSFGANSSTTQIQHGPNLAPLRSRNFGTFWRLCRNSALSDGTYAYQLRIPTHAEYFKAMDFGDVDFDGAFDQSPFNPNGGVVRTVENNGSVDNTCNTSAAVENTGLAKRLECSSRYGVNGQIGNAWNVTTGQQYSTVGLDDGIDGLLHGWNIRQNEYPGGGSGTGLITFDLLRGMPVPDGTASWNVRRNDDRNMSEAANIGNNSGLRSVLPGGGWYANQSGGRWHIYISLPPTGTNGEYSFRCGF